MRDVYGFIYCYFHRNLILAAGAGLEETETNSRHLEYSTSDPAVEDEASNEEVKHETKEEQQSKDQEITMLNSM